MANPQEHQPYHPQDTMANTFKVLLQSTAVGAIFAGAQNSLQRNNVGMMGIFTRSGGIIAMFGGIGATFQFTVDSAANLRQKDDAYNHAIAGFVAGMLPGLPRRSLPFMLGCGTALGTIMAAFKYTGGFMPKKERTPEEEIEKREKMKKNRRRPIEETIEEMGEGRGIYAPGWEERRRNRLKEKYGIDVAALPPTPNTP